MSEEVLAGEVESEVEEEDEGEREEGEVGAKLCERLLGEPCERLEEEKRVGEELREEPKKEEKEEVLEGEPEWGELGGVSAKELGVEHGEE